MQLPKIELELMSDFKCDNCRKVKPGSERANVLVPLRVLFMVTQVILAGTITWSSELCKQCVRQRLLLSGLIASGLFVLVAFFM